MKNFSLQLSIIISILLTFNLTQENLIDDAPKICELIKIEVKAPKPSLSKCYKYNTGACCNSVHDETINSNLANLLPSSCLIKYPLLIDLFCLGCSPFQTHFTDKKAKKLKICKSFLESLWIPEDVRKNVTDTSITLDKVKILCLENNDF